MSRRRSFTSESVSGGHPHKVCDLIADTIIDAYLERDAKGRPEPLLLDGPADSAVSAPPQCLTCIASRSAAARLHRQLYDQPLEEGRRALFDENPRAPTAGAPGAEARA